jgi:hypothetical protein
MPLGDSWTVSIAYYEPGQDGADLANACCGELLRLRSELQMTSDGLLAAVRRRELTERVERCRYHVVNFLARVYAVRERAWDVAAALTDTKRPRTLNKDFTREVQSALEEKHPTVATAFSNLNRTIDSDVKLRNVATHRTFVWLSLVRMRMGEVEEVDDLYDILMNVDPDDPGYASDLRKMGKALSDYVREERRHIQEVTSAVLDFVGVVDVALQSDACFR